MRALPVPWPDLARLVLRSSGGRRARPPRGLGYCWAGFWIGGKFALMSDTLS